MQMKNNHSSTGRPSKLMPVRYLGLKPQTPLSVNAISQTMNGIIVRTHPIVKAFQWPANLIRGWNAARSGMQITPTSTAR